MSTIMACACDKDPSTRRDAMSIVSLLCENESDHQQVLKMFPCLHQIHSIKLNCSSTQVIQAGGLKALDSALSSDDVETEK